MNSAVLKKIQKLPEAYRKEFATLINDLQASATSEKCHDKYMAFVNQWLKHSRELLKAS